MAVQGDKVEQFGIISHNQYDKVEDLYKFTCDMFGEPKRHMVEAAEIALDKARQADENQEDKLITLAIIAMAGYKLYTGLDANKIANLMTDTYKRKNADYGNSFDESIDKFGIVAAMVRMSDKVNRLKSLVLRENKVEVKDESIADTWLDLANYSIMTILYGKFSDFRTPNARK